MKFTFQYGTTKTFSFDIIRKAFKKFTFQYGTTKTSKPRNNIKKKKNLHSNMVLLKQDINIFLKGGFFNLHSNMVLLKLRTLACYFYIANEFTFQYGTTKTKMLNIKKTINLVFTFQYGTTKTREERRV